MSRIKIIHNEPAISEEQIEKHKDFDQLLGKFNSLKTSRPSVRKYKTGLGLAGLILLAGTFLYVYKNNTASEQPFFVPHYEKVPPVEVPHQGAPVAKISPEPKTEGQAKAEQTAGLPEKREENEALTHEMSRNAEVKEEKLPLKDSEKAKAGDTEEEIALSYTEAVPKKGMQHLYRYFNENLRYPQEEMMEKKEGTVILSFSVTREGKAAAVEVVQKVSDGIDAEAVRLIKEMPEWTPAFVKGKAVNSRVTLPVTFQINDSDEK